MIKIDLHSQAPLYEQIKTGFKGLVRRKLLRPGDAAPSIRALAAQLTLNPNTVARAYRELTAEGFFESQRGEENIVSARAGALAKADTENLKARIAEAVKEGLRNGLTPADIETILGRVKKENI
ncbi:MAG: GntR family transcriptional regulator [Elusimicrobia bacterium]|nr:GntR family transcriptional regulator [Elusimicrobiota bacterium]